MYSIIGIILILAAVIIHFWLEKRQFERTSFGGVEEFNSYAALWINRAIEVPAKLIRILAAISGIVFIVIGFHLN